METSGTTLLSFRGYQQIIAALSPSTKEFLGPGDEVELMFFEASLKVLTPVRKQIQADLDKIPGVDYANVAYAAANNQKWVAIRYFPDLNTVEGVSQAVHRAFARAAYELELPDIPKPCDPVFGSDAVTQIIAMMEPPPAALLPASPDISHYPTADTAAGWPAKRNYSDQDVKIGCVVIIFAALVVLFVVGIIARIIWSIA